VIQTTFFPAVPLTVAFCVLMPVAGSDVFSTRVSVCLNGDWERHDGGDVTTVPAEGWKTVRVPEAPDEVAEGSAWFRLDFHVPEEFGADNRRILLRFIRVRHYARVFLKGRVCGENFGARAPFEIDVTDAAKPGESNRLDVWVHNSSGSYAMEGKFFTDADIEILKRLSTTEAYQRAATIAEDVFLVSRPALHVCDVLVMPSVRERRLDVRCTVRNDTLENRTIKLLNRVYLEGAAALSLPDMELQVDAGEEETVLVSAPWEEPKLWGFGDYGSPILYHLETTIEQNDGVVVDRLVSRFGFREVWAERGKIVMNGRPLRLLGYWQPEGSGRSLWTLRMAAVQASGCNTIHNHAEQREPSYYDVADEMGMLVWDANFCGGPLGTTKNMVTDRVFPDVQAELVRQWPEWARVVGNHPSVVMIMIGCLIHQDSNIAMARAYRSYDPTRLLQANGAPADAPLDVAAYTSHFTMFDEDPLSDIRTSYENWGSNRGRRADGTQVPLVNSECWYHSSRQNEETGQWEQAAEEDVAKATEEAIDWLARKPLVGLNLYTQQAFRPFHDEGGIHRPSWPSRSGLGQHSETGRTGGFEWVGPDYVNYWDPSEPPCQATATFRAQRRAAKRFLGYEVAAAATRRPTVLVKVVHGNEHVANAYVYAVPVKGTNSDTLGMRTDANGTAWFELRDPGTWRFMVSEQGTWKDVLVDAPLQPLDTRRGGLGTIIEAVIDVAD